MPVKLKETKKEGRKLFRVVESRTGRVVTRNGSAIDGGGHRTRSRAVAQVRAVNLSERRAEGKPAPPRKRRRRG